MRKLQVTSTIQVLLVLSATLVCVGCSQAHPSKEQLVGAWKVEHNFGTETLVLLADGTYTQKLVKKGRQSTENKGDWELRLSELILHDALVFSTPFGEREPNAPRRDWTLDTLHEWGRLILSFSPDLPGFHKE